MHIPPLLVVLAAAVAAPVIGELTRAEASEEEVMRLATARPGDKSLAQPLAQTVQELQPL